MSYEAKLKAMGVEIPEPVKPLASYIPAVQVGNMIYTSGQIPMKDGKRLDFDFEHCKGCGICAKACPFNAIVMHKGGKE